MDYCTRRQTVTDWITYTVLLAAVVEELTDVK